MILTRSAYIQNEKTEMLAEGLPLSDINGFNFDNEYYNLLKDYVKQGNKISNEVFKDLPQGQKHHFIKHYNYNNDKIINSDYDQQLAESKKLNDEKFNKYLLEKESERKEQEQRDLKVKIRELTQELELLKCNLFNYDKLSVIVKRNYAEHDHNKKQDKIKNEIAEINSKIIELQNNISQLAG